MKSINKQHILPISTLLALVLLLIVQVNWLFRAAKLEEQNFNHKVSVALKEARQEIGKRVHECMNMENFLCGKCESHTASAGSISEIDSIIRSQLDINHIQLEYTFDIIADSQDPIKKANWFTPRCYLQSLNGLLSKNGIQIRLEFPNRNKFLLAQMKGTFAISTLAIIFIMVSFIITLRMFSKERKMMTQTTDFINNMVHEFQTPLSNIQLANNLIKKKEKENDKVQEYSDIITNENNKLKSHVDQILGFACPHKGYSEYSSINLHHLLNEAIANFNHILKEREGIITCNFKADNFEIKGNGSHFIIVFSNLIDNAIKYSPNPPIIEIATKNREGELIISVADRGIGIAKQETSKIFDRYYRVSTGNVHNVKGFGLGLAYIKKVISEYNGKIKVESQPGKGTRFIILLPLIAK